MIHYMVGGESILIGVKDGAGMAIIIIEKGVDRKISFYDILSKKIVILKNY